MGVVMKPRSFLILVLIVLLGLWKGSYSLEEEERQEEKDLKEMLLGEMDAHHENNDVNKMGVKEHVEMLNNQYFGKQKLFHNKDHLDAHAPIDHILGDMNAEDDEGAVEYSWENVSKKSWESVREDEKGNIVTKNTYNTGKERLRRAKLHRTQSTKCVRRDCSVHAKATDYKPSRLGACKSALEKFFRDFFDQNPISQISLSLTRDGIAEKLTDLSGNPKSHAEMLGKVSRAEGTASLQNVLNLAIAGLKHVPQYGSREVFISCDFGDIFDTIEEVKKVKIKCSVICLSAEVYICRRLAEETGGKFAVALDFPHFAELLMQHTTPLPIKRLSSKKRSRDGELEDETYADLIYMGFPSRSFDQIPMIAFNGRGEITVTSTSYMCPRCGARVTEIPTKCSVCSLQLSSSSHIARSYHHLFPVPLFLEQSTNNDPSTKSLHCFGCSENLRSAFSADNMEHKMSSQCPRCENFFCVECDIFIHDSLHNCPGCLP